MNKPDIKVHNYPNEYQKLFSLASLFEGTFSIDWLVDLMDIKASQILFILEKGIEDGWLIKKDPGVFCFVNSEKREIWKDRLSSEDKMRLHEQIVSVLLRELPEDNTRAKTISHHLLHTSNNDVDKCHWLVKAGDSYVQVFEMENALQCFTKVLDDLSDIRDGEADYLFIETIIKYSKISTARHDTQKILSLLKEAMIRAKRMDNQTYQALLKMHLAKNEWLCSRYYNALKQFEEGWLLAKELDNPKLLHSVNTFSTFFLYWQGRFREAIQSYEKSMTEVEKFPQGRFSVLAAVTVGVCYTQIGQVTQGLGMLDAILTHAREKGDQYLAAYAGAAVGATMLDIRRIKDALKYLECAVKDAGQTHNEWVQIMGSLMLALAYSLNNESKKSIAYLRKFLQSSNQVHVSVQPYPYLMELCWAMEQGKLPHLPDLSLEREIQQMVMSENVFMKGVGYKFQALLEIRKGALPGKVIESLNSSLQYLKESGHQIEIAQSQLELARQYLLLGGPEKAKEMVLMASKVLCSFNEELVPDDLRSLIKVPLQRETLLNEILKLGQEIVTVRDNRDLTQHIISTVNRLTGAERGAIFILDGSPRRPTLRLRASKNITSEQIAHPSFNSAMKMIEEVARAGKGLIQEEDSGMVSDSHPSEIIRSCICVPMILRGKVVGVLYHDNRLLSSAFKESDLEFLAYFAALAAFALDNAQAYEEIQLLNQKLKEEKLYYEEQHLESLHIEDVIGESLPIKQVLAQVDQVAKADTTVLIYGETGVGKELVARAIHRHSLRQDKPFIRVQCSALPESLITSELFGHEKGAFTGAIQRRIGRFELADGGTLFLDEIGDLPKEVQVRLLRVLQSKEFERVGGSETLHSDFRLVVATNRNLEEEIKASRFRADLYFRLNVFPIYVPPLRERKDDIPMLVRYFISIYGTKTGKTFDRIPEEEIGKLIQYDWPGNVRELENIIERGTILNHGPTFCVPKPSIDSLGFGLQREYLTLRENERRHIQLALLKTGWKIRGPGGAAELLEIHPSTLAFKMKKLGILRPEGLSKRRSAIRSISPENALLL